MKYLTVQEVANRWNVSIITVRNYIRDGKLEALKLKRSFRIAENVVEEFERNHHFKSGSYYD